MLGLPEEFVTSVPNGSVTGSRIGGIVYPTMIGLT